MAIYQISKKQRMRRIFMRPAVIAAVIAALILAVVCTVMLQQKSGAGAVNSGRPAAENGFSEKPAGAAAEDAGKGNGDSGVQSFETGGKNAKKGEKILIHVVGAVKTPGVVELPAESRVAEAIEAAGGASEKAQLAAINLARQLQDGEQLLVPTPEDIAAGRGAANNSAAGPGGSVPGGKININTATAEQLQTLPKVGPALAARIIDWRKTHGKFKNIDQLREVSGIGEKMFAGLKDKVTV